MDFITFNTIANKNRLSAGEREYNLLSKFVELLIEWNTKINLISRKDVENIWEKHVFGSLSVLFNHRLKSNAKIVDVGCGGGFPGIPLAICLPDASFLLVDSILKKITVVTDIFEKLQLSNVETVCGRAEELNMKAVYNRKFDYATARAVAPIADVLRWSKMFLRTISPNSDASQEENENTTSEKVDIAPGAILIYKGGDISSELQAARIKYRPKSVESFPLIIDGINPIDFSDKKIVIVRP